MSGKDPFCCSGGSQQVWVPQVHGVLSVSHPVGFAHHPFRPSSFGVAEGLLPVWALVLPGQGAPVVLGLTKDIAAPGEVKPWRSPGLSRVQQDLDQCGTG